jgi:hypothetical protein
MDQKKKETTVTDFPRKDYQAYGLEMFRKAVRDLYDAADEVDRMLVKMADYDVDEVVDNPAEFYASLQGLWIGTPKTAGIQSGTTASLFLIRKFAHELSLLIAHQMNPSDEHERTRDGRPTPQTTSTG